MTIFQEINPPRKQSRLVINRCASWYTWSVEFRSVYERLSAQLHSLKKPRSMRVLGGKEYDNTFSVDIASISDKVLARDLSRFARSLYELKVSDRMMLFDDMLCEEPGGGGIHFIFAYFREAIVRLTGDPMAALSQPLHREFKWPKAFPLHSDLYIPRLLFNLFEDVPDDSSGASLFLPVSVFLEILGGLKSIDEASRRQIAGIITGDHSKDCYEEFYHLLHGDDNEWKTEMERQMSLRQMRIKLYAGQGYLINDRLWLHGREGPSTGVTKKRFHRLIFNNRECGPNNRP
jgi:hypothetical protein